MEHFATVLKLIGFAVHPDPANATVARLYAERLKEALEQAGEHQQARLVQKKIDGDAEPVAPMALRD